MIAIVDYGVGNIASVKKAFESLGHDVIVTDNETQLKQATHIILPGVGSFPAAMAEIESRNLKALLIQLASEKPFLGICLGMQLLFDFGTEGKYVKGLGLIPGSVEKIETSLVLPHIGWNQLNVTTNDQTFTRFNEQYVYFVHSYQARTDASYIVASTDYDLQVPAIVRHNNVYGMQFHPEKSAVVGIALLEWFLNTTTENTALENKGSY